jgi:hypothetical protein
MKFSIRDLLWLMALLGTAAASAVLGFLVGDGRKRMILEMENSTMKIEQFMDRDRIESLEDELKKAGIALPEKD